nr:MAG TPA: hypothetical protein [Caudoviricetes sp.]DAY63381.1 MAG TPA: hypothetical protein [Caudoviricetes sp.]
MQKLHYFSNFAFRIVRFFFRLTKTYFISISYHVSFYFFT